MLRLPARLREEMIAHALHESPIEACGYLLGNACRVQEVIPMYNMDQSPEHFSFDPFEQFKVVKEARAKGLGVLGVYHSHPASPARMSAEDLRLAHDPHMLYVIVSLQDLSPVIKAFRVRNKEPEEVILEETEGENGE